MHLDLIKPNALLLAVLLVAGCSGEAPEAGTPDASPTGSPQAAVKAMLALAEAGRWEEYVTTYYGELHKMDEPETQIPQLAAGLETVGATVVETLRACVAETPIISEDCTQAVYTNKFTLHERDGKWGFHL
jgi:hypothetical protein